MKSKDQDVIKRFPVGYYDLHPNISLNFQMNRFWNWVGDDVMLNELRDAGKRIENYDDWARIMFELSEKAIGQGRNAAGAYYAKMAIFFLPESDSRVKPALALFSKTVLEESKITEKETFFVPYGDSKLTAYRLTPPEPRGQLVLFGGYDSYITEWLPAALAFRDAGLDTVIFDGPGQGTVLDAGVPMTPDWHQPVAAILDFFKFDDVTLVGFSLGGCLVLRATAFEPRVKRAVAMDVFTDLFESASRGFDATGLSVIADNSDRIPDQLVNTTTQAVQGSDLLTDWVIAQGKRVLGVSTPAELFKAWRTYRTADISPLIKQDVLLMAGTKDHYMPFHMVGDQINSLTSAHSITTRVFTEAESAQNHAQIGNIGLAISVILDWMDARGGRQPTDISAVA